MALSTWLYSWDHKYDLILLLEAKCPRHPQRLVMEWCGFNYPSPIKEGGRGPQHRIKLKEQPVWLARKQMYFKATQDAKLPKDTRPIVFVGDYTLKVKVSRDPSKALSFS
jgi:hypothetical protein